MRKYGKWVLTLSLMAATPGLTLAAGPKSKDAKSAPPARTAKADVQRKAEEIANALRGRVQGENLSIEFKNGVATLSGSVADAKMKKTAETLTGKVAGVTKVDNRLTVAEKKPVAAERTRGGARGGILQAAHASEDAEPKRVQQVNAEYAEGMVPAAEPQYQAAQPAARSVNQEMAEHVGSALSAAQLDNYEIQISFQNGVVTLDGSVATPAERALAAREAGAVPGVRSVSNRLRCLQEAHAGQAAQGYPARGDIRGAGYMQPGPGPGMGGQPMPPQMAGGMPMGPGAPPYPPAYGYQPTGPGAAVYNSPSMPDYAWPTYAQYPNSAAVTYPTQYSASAWPYIGPFYPYPQVPLGWRDATLRWDDGQWNLMFRPRTDRWWWFLNPNNW